MQNEAPRISIVIPARFDEAEIAAVRAAGRLEKPNGPLEILVSRGTQPSRQRNLALEEARGEWVYFLDDDSRPDPANLERMRRHFEDPQVVMLGGPAICPRDATFLQHCFSAVMGSYLAFGPSRSRYHATGVIRATGEKELILCNLAARREAVRRAGGFDEKLYPNEENALMDKLQAEGGKLIYDPAFVAERYPRRTLRAFFRMLWNYGRGRAEQLRVLPSAGSLANLAPPLFVLYLLAMAWLPAWGIIPLLAYGALWILQVAALAASNGWGAAAVAGILIPLSHIAYGAGFWRGLFTRLHPDSRGDVRVERVEPPRGS